MNETLTNRHLERAFGVTSMTLYLWRQGTKTRDPLPAEKSERSREVSYKPAPVERWARKYGIPILVEDGLKSLLGDIELARRKVGRKRSAVESEKQEGTS